MLLVLILPNVVDPEAIIFCAEAFDSKIFVVVTLLQNTLEDVKFVVVILLDVIPVINVLVAVILVERVLEDIILPVVIESELVIFEERKLPTVPLPADSDDEVKLVNDPVLVTKMLLDVIF
jgi:hypothetical protein